MEKLVEGALTFRRHVFSAYRDLFSRLALAQKPEALFVACSDSRIVPNLITTAAPGDLFMVRNVGNIVPAGDTSSAEGAALEFAVGSLGVRDIVVCGHSGCGAMKATLSRRTPQTPHLRAWLRHAAPAVELLRQRRSEGLDLPAQMDREARSAAVIDALGRLNVLVQLEHLRTHPLVRERIEQGSLHLHGWFFEIDSAQLHTYDPVEQEFVPLVDSKLRQ